MDDATSPTSPISPETRGAMWGDLFTTELAARSAQHHVTKRALIFLECGLPLPDVLDALKIDRDTWVRSLRGVRGVARREPRRRRPVCSLTRGRAVGWWRRDRRRVSAGLHVPRDAAPRLGVHARRGPGRHRADVAAVGGDRRALGRDTARRNPRRAARHPGLGGDHGRSASSSVRRRQRARTRCSSRATAPGGSLPASR